MRRNQQTRASTGACRCCPGCEGQPPGLCVSPGHQSCRGGTNPRAEPAGLSAAAGGETGAREPSIDEVRQGSSTPGSGGSPGAVSQLPTGEGFSSHGCAEQAKEKELPMAVSLRLLLGDLDQRITESLRKDLQDYQVQPLIQYHRVQSTI